MNSRSQGFTLVEILIVTLLSAIVMGSIYQMIVMQDRTTREQYAIVETQQNARAALSILTSDLKEISAVGGDVVAADSTSITFRALRKAGIACSPPTFAGTVVNVHELGGAFVAGDSVAIFAEGPNANSANDDAWLMRRISAVTPINVATCGVGDPFGATAWRQLTFVGLVPLNGVTTGALIRSYKPTRYRITDNGEWGQLMRTEDGNEVAIIEHLASTADGGLRFRYFDAAGTQMPNNAIVLANIMRVQVKVRGKAASQVDRAGNNRFQDSLVTTVYLRGNFRTQ